MKTSSFLEVCWKSSILRPFSKLILVYFVDTTILTNCRKHNLDTGHFETISHDILSFDIISFYNNGPGTQSNTNVFQLTQVACCQGPWGSRTSKARHVSPSRSPAIHYSSEDAIASAIPSCIAPDIHGQTEIYTYQ